MSPVCFCHQHQVLYILRTNEMWVFTFPSTFTLGLTLAVFPAAGHYTCDASSRQRSHWCCWPSCAQVQLFIDWCWQSKYICCFRLLIFCRCELSHVSVCPVVTVECDSACSQHLCRYVCDRYFAHAINNWIMLYGIYIYTCTAHICTHIWLCTLHICFKC